MPLYSTQLLDVVPPGQPEETTTPVKPVSWELFGPAYASGIATKLCLDKDDFTGDFPPGKIRLLLTRKDTFEAMREAIACVYPFSLIVSCLEFPYPQLKDEISVRVDSLLRENYVVAPYWLKHSRLKMGGLVVPRKGTDWSKGIRCWGVEHLFVGGSEWTLKGNREKSLRFWLDEMLAPDFVERYQTVMQQIGAVLEKAAIPSGLGIKEGEWTR